MFRQPFAVRSNRPGPRVCSQTEGPLSRHVGAVARLAGLVNMTLEPVRCCGARSCIVSRVGRYMALVQDYVVDVGFVARLYDGLQGDHVVLAI